MEIGWRINNEDKVFRSMFLIGFSFNTIRVIFFLWKGLFFPQPHIIPYDRVVNSSVRYRFSDWSLPIVNGISEWKNVKREKYR